MTMANYKGINEVCKKVDELQTVPSTINLWALEVGPFSKEIPTSHFIFMQEYFEAKIEAKIYDKINEYK